MGKPNAGSCHTGGAKSRAKENISEGQCQLQHIERQQMTITTCLARTCCKSEVLTTSHIALRNGISSVNYNRV